MNCETSRLKQKLLKSKCSYIFSTKNAKVNIELKLCQLLPDILAQKLSHTGGLTGGDNESRFKESDDSIRM